MKKPLLGLSCAALLLVIGLGSMPALTFDGPKKGKGLRFEVLSEINLGPEIAGMQGRRLRYRYWWIEPGGVIPVHGHEDRPAIIRMLKGEIIEHRSDRKEPVVHKAGETTKESGGVVHWWENKGTVTVELIAADICNAKAGAC